MKRLAVLVALVAAPAALAAPDPLAVSIAADPAIVTFGDSTDLSGAVSPAAVMDVALSQQPCMDPGPRLGDSAPLSVLTTAGGAWTATTTPVVTTTYQVRAGQTRSPELTVQVRPRITLFRTAPHRFYVHIAAAKKFGGRIALFQRQSSIGVWKTVKSVRLRSLDSASDAYTSGRTFLSGVARRSLVRVMLTQRQAGDCYLGAVSNAVRA